MLHLPEVKGFAESPGRQRRTKTLFLRAGSQVGRTQTLLLLNSRGKTLIRFTAARTGPEPGDEGNFSTVKEIVFFFFFFLFNHQNGE